MNEDLTREMPEQEPTLRQLYSLMLQMNQRLNQLEEKVETRLYDTRPLWERVIGEIEKLRAGQEELNKKYESLDGKYESLRQELATFRAETNHNLKLINHKFKDVFASIGDVSARTSELEKHFPITENY